MIINLLVEKLWTLRVAALFPRRFTSGDRSFRRLFEPCGKKTADVAEREAFTSDIHVIRGIRTVDVGVVVIGAQRLENVRSRV